MYASGGCHQRDLDVGDFDAGGDHGTLKKAWNGCGSLFGHRGLDSDIPRFPKDNKIREDFRVQQLVLPKAETKLPTLHDPLLPPRPFHQLHSG